ncbi:hypothetical protein AALC17_18530 [Oscillospiraceae bacterium 38-13]
MAQKTEVTLSYASSVSRACFSPSAVAFMAGGSGITPFYSMAAAIVSGLEDFNLTILYGSRTSDNILLKEELEELAQNSGGKVKVIHVLSDEEKAGYEHGFITAELIRKYAPKKYSLFICGPKPLHAFADEQVKKLGLKPKHVRRELHLMLSLYPLS